jgi:c-di-GMP-binding flagellar brake protein YcgR
MDNVSAATIIGLVFSIIVMVLILIANTKAIKKKDLQLIDMGKKIKELREKLNGNKRKAFRIDIPPENCRIEFLDFGEKALMNLLHRTGSGKIMDISVKGLRFVCDYDLPLKNDITIGVDFEFQGEKFYLNGTLIRKEAHLHMPEITYGMEFIQMSSADQGRLTFVLNRIQMERRKKMA